MGNQVSLKDEKSVKANKTPFCGLYNLGCTCYLSSVTQALGAVPAMRKKVLEQRAKGGMSPLCESLTDLLNNMHTTRRSSVSPKAMLRNANKVSSYWNATDQQDALEFFDFLMDASYCYDMLFTGKLERQYICTGCDSICRRQESYRNISVTCNAQVRSLKGALDNYQAPEYLTGDNLYDCDRCKIKTVGKCQTWIQKYPSVLTISLIKYDVNRESGCYGKVNNLIKIDLELPFEARCGGQSNIDVDEIEDGDKVNGGGKVNGGRERSRDSGHNSRGFGTENEDRDLDLVSDASTTDTNQNSIIRYKLTSIILHIGASVASGHYVTVVRRQQEWFLVDDHKVSRLTSQELDRLLNNEEPTSTPPKTERDRIIDNRNTYLLFYTRTM